jgi:actin-related protein 3
MALYSSAYIEKINNGGVASYDLNLTGTVLDSGDGVTHIIPISDGYVIGSCIKHIPLAGRDITKFIMQMLRDRGESILPEDLLQVSKEIKEKYTYLSSGNLEKEFQKFDTRQENGDPSRKFKKHEFISQTNGQVNIITLT